MTDESIKIGLGVGELANELRNSDLPRRALRDRLKAFGIGFGAAFTLGLGGAHAATPAATAAVLTSTNPAVDAILKEGMQLPGPVAKEGIPLQQMTYFRSFGRVYSRLYTRFSAESARGRATPK